MNIIHMSDLHLTADKESIWGVDTYRHFLNAINRIQSFKDIDCIVVTGDIADDGKPETYEYADKMFEELGIPTFWCYGNHDNISNLNRSHLSFIRICNETELMGLRIIFVNSVKVDDENPSCNCSKGYVSETELDRIKNVLESTGGGPTIIAMHHPSIEPGGWLTDKILKNRIQFYQLISLYNVICVLYGHIHYFTSIKIKDTIFSSCSSIGFAFDKDLPKFEIAEGKEGFSLIAISNNSIKIENILI